MLGLLFRVRGRRAREDFLVGFVTPAGDVWGRPLGVAVAKGGAPLVTDDGSNTAWRVSCRGR